MAAITGRLNVKVRDGQGLIASTSNYVNTSDAATLAEVATWLDVFTGLMNNVTGGIIYQAEFHLIPALTLTPNAGTGTNVSDSLVLSFPVTGLTTRSDFVVPAIAAANLLGGHPVMTEGGAIDLLADYMEAPFQMHVAGDSTFTNRDIINLTASARGAHSFRKPGHQLSKSKTPGV